MAPRRIYGKTGIEPGRRMVFVRPRALGFVRCRCRSGDKGRPSGERCRQSGTEIGATSMSTSIEPRTVPFSEAHRTLGIGVLYAITIIGILAVVARFH